MTEAEGQRPLQQQGADGDAAEQPPVATTVTFQMLHMHERCPLFRRRRVALQIGLFSSGDFVSTAEDRLTQA